MTPEKPIPHAILAPLAEAVWMHDEYSRTKFAEMLKSHARGDARSDCTSAYNLANYGDSISASDLHRMVQEGAIRPEFFSGSAVNQHWLHSLEQFYAVVFHEWAEHLRRTDAIIGTPAGRIHQPGR